MKHKIEYAGYDGLADLSQQELSGIYGGDFPICDPSNCLFSYAIHIAWSLIADNIEHPIGAEGGYPPK